MGRGGSVVVAGGSYGGFIALEYAIAYPDRVRAMVLRDTAADATTLDLAQENARRQTGSPIDWEQLRPLLERTRRRDDELKSRWAEMIPLYDLDYDAVRSAAAVEAGIYRHEAHNWCFQHNTPAYDLK